MAIVLARIDDRLVHGQVVEGWIPHLKAQRVVVVCDAAAADPVQQTLMQLALPDSVSLLVLPAAQAADVLRVEDARRTLVLAPSPREFVLLLEAGVPLAAVNVGGLHYSAGRIQLGRVIFLSDADLRDLRFLAERGVVLEGRAVPSDSRMDVAGMLAAVAR